MVNTSVVPSVSSAQKKKKKKKIQELGCQIFPDLCRGKVASLPGLKGYSWEEAWAGKQEQDAPLEE